MAKKKQDKQLKWKRLRMTRVLFLIENIGIFGILIYGLMTKDENETMDNPVLLVLLITGIVSAHLAMNKIVEHETSKETPKRKFLFSLILDAIIALVFGFVVSMMNDMETGLLSGVIIFGCFLVISFYIFYVRTKNK